MRFALLFGILVAANAAAAQTPFERGSTLDPSGAVRVHALAGSITVIGWDRDSVHVKGTFARGTTPYSGGSRTIWKMSIYDGLPTDSAPAHFSIYVPRRAQVWIKTTTASISAQGVTGSVDLNTVEGRVEVKASPSELRVETMRGHVAVNGTPGWVRLKSGGGDIVFEGAAEDASLSTIKGSITTSSRLQRGRIETVGGAVRLVGPLLRGAVLDLDSHGGAISVTLDKPVNAEFSIFTMSGRISTALFKGAPEKSSGAGTQLDFAVGSPSAGRVRIRTFSGGITIRSP